MVHEPAIVAKAAIMQAASQHAVGRDTGTQSLDRYDHMVSPMDADTPSVGEMPDLGSLQLQHQQVQPVDSSAEAQAAQVEAAQVSAVSAMLPTS